MAKLIFILLLILSIGVGVYLATSKTSFFGKASESIVPEGIIISNITGNSLTLTWFTSLPLKSLVNYGTSDNNLSNSASDDRDRGMPLNRKSHFVTLKNLNPGTQYFFTVNGGGQMYEAKTGPIVSGTPDSGRQYAGDALVNENVPASEAILYFKTENGQLLSVVVNLEGKFTLNTRGYRSSDLTQFSDIEFIDRVKFLVQSAEDGTGYLETLAGTNHPLKIFTEAKYIPFYKIQQGGLVREPSATSSASTEEESTSFFDWFWVKLR